MRVPIRKINKLMQTINSEIPHINCGGCGVFASLLYPFLQELGTKPIIRLVHRSETNTDLSDIRRQLEDTNSCLDWQQHTWFTHLLIEFTNDGKQYVIDSTGIFNLDKSEYYACEGAFSYEEVKYFAASPSGWNTMFPRRTIPVITKKLSSGFSELFPTIFIKGAII